MAATQTGLPTLDAVDRAIGDGFRHLRFPPAIERLFLVDYAKNRTRLVPLWALLGTMLFALAALGDPVMLPDVAPLVLTLRFGVFVPFAMLTVLCIRRRPHAGVYDGFSLAIGILGVGLPMTALAMSQSPYAYIFQTGSMCTFLYFSVVLRTRFPVAIVGLVAMCAIQLLTTRLNGTIDEITFSGIATFFFIMSVFLAMGAYFLEYSERQNFIQRLRATLLHEQLRHSSEHDELSGLRNRRSLGAYVGALWQTGPRNRAVAAILIDVDNFKLYNDAAGHSRGDRCLRAISDSIADMAAVWGEVFRFGGEEILVLLPDRELDEAIAHAEAMRLAVEGLALPHPGLGEGDVVTISLGVSHGRVAAQSFELLLEAADAALYEAKRSGRNAVRPQAAGLAIPRLQRAAPLWRSEGQGMFALRETA